MTLIFLLIILFISGIIALIVILTAKSKNAKSNQPFEVLPDPPPEPEKPDPRSTSGQHVPKGTDGSDLTVKLFDYDAYGSTLKSYVLELYDLRKPGQGYRVNVSDRITIGRGSKCTVCIPNRTLSSEHCEIVLNNGRLFLRDLNSLNGTYLNGNPNKVTEAYLESGSVIQIGSEKLQVQIREVNG